MVAEWAMHKEDNGYGISNFSITHHSPASPGLQRGESCILHLLLTVYAVLYKSKTPLFLRRFLILTETYFFILRRIKAGISRSSSSTSSLDSLLGAIPRG